MCGIAGRFSVSRLSPNPLWGERADDLLSHRGPDGSGYYRDDYCELIHRRLALVDLSPTGHQPMPNEDGNIQLVFNGEIYNHSELRNILKGQGHIFRGTSDTEVLVHLYEQYGTEMVSKIRGMFAFAVYDKRHHQLFLARDRFGIKPLYYALLKDEFIFASEIKALLVLPDFRPTLDRQACYDYLGLGYIPEPSTIFMEIKALPKGEHILFKKEGGFQKNIYYELEISPHGYQNLDEVIESASKALLCAVNKQRMADVPVAALSSGGIDSSLIVAAYGKDCFEKSVTFNVKFKDNLYDETKFAMLVSQHCQTTHHTIELQDSILSGDVILNLLRHFDQPFADTSLIPTYLICRAIREQGFICALSGDGGDEVFGGYARFWRANQFAAVLKYPDWFRAGMERTGNILSQFTLNRGRQLSKAMKLVRETRNDIPALISGLSNYLTEEEKKVLVLPDARRDLLPVSRHFTGSFKGSDYLEDLSKGMTENLFSISLPSDMLRKVDMMSMKAGIEIRVPMLDEDLVALGLTLSHRLKTDGHQGKLVLRALAHDWLPKLVAQRPKHGFNAPLDRLVAEDFYDLLDDFLLADSSRIRTFVNIPLVRNWLNLFRQAKGRIHGGTISREGLYQRIFILLALEISLREHNLTW